METDVALETLPERVRGWKNKKILENWKNSKDKYFIFFLYYFIKLIGKPKFSKVCPSLSFPLPFLLNIFQTRTVSNTIALKFVSTIFLFFHQMIALKKIRKMHFISSKKVFLFSTYSNFCMSLLPILSFCQPLLEKVFKGKY